MQLCHRVPYQYTRYFADKSGFSYALPAYLVGRMEAARSELPPPVAIGVSWEPKRMEADAVVAREFGDSLVLCPFIPFDSGGTRFLFKTFLDAASLVWKDRKPKLVAVPQGKTVEDFETCFFEMLTQEERLYGFGLTAGTLAAMGNFYTGTQDCYPNRLTYYRKRLAQYITRSSKAVVLLETGNATAHELSDFTAGALGEVFCISSAAFSAAIEHRELRKEGSDHRACGVSFEDILKEPVGDDLLALAASNMDYLNEFIR